MAWSTEGKMRAPPGRPSAMAGRPSRSTSVGAMELVMRVPGATESVWPGCGSKRNIVLFSSTPVPGAIAREPNRLLIVCVDGTVVAATQTINSLFGSRAMAPGTGVLLNNTMFLFDPHPGHTLSVAPGTRMTSSMAPTLVLRDGRPAMALGLPGGARIFPSVLQAIVNVIDHG